MTMTHELGLHLNGLEQLQIMLDQDLRCPIAKTLDIKMVEAEDGRAVFEATPDQHLYNPNYFVHGGFSATMMDFACGYASMSKIPAGKSVSTIDLKVSYHRPINKDTGLLRAEGIVTSSGKRVIFSEAKLTDQDGRLYVSATSSVLVFNLE
ncbi:MAG: thioesterase [Alcaligenaceae bacterium]|nr:thioesterase [Alcaligenaceae bacterium]